MNGLNGFIIRSYEIVNGLLIPIALALCLLYFFWGVARYIRSGAGGESAAKEGRDTMVWGVVALFVLFSIWGIIRFIRAEFNIRNINNIDTMNSVSF